MMIAPLRIQLDCGADGIWWGSDGEDLRGGQCAVPSDEGGEDHICLGISRGVSQSLASHHAERLLYRLKYKVD
jgi:hypothetical protein